MINNIACSAIAALFLYMLRSKLIEHKLDTATWFVLLFLAYGLAYTTSSLRFILPMGFAIFVNNLLYQLGGYCMLFAVLRWYQSRSKWLIPTDDGALLVVCFVVISLVPFES